MYICVCHQMSGFPSTDTRHHCMNCVDCLWWSVWKNVAHTSTFIVLNLTVILFFSNCSSIIAFSVIGLSSNLWIQVPIFFCTCWPQVCGLQSWHQNVSFHRKLLIPFESASPKYMVPLSCVKIFSGVTGFHLAASQLEMCWQYPLTFCFYLWTTNTGTFLL